MNTDFQAILLKILEAIDYTDDKNVFVDEFIGLTQMEAVGSLIQTLPQEQQESIKKELEADLNNPTKIAQIIKTHFSEDQLQKAFEEAAKKGIETWMQAVEPTLTDMQKQKLSAVSQELLQ